MEIELCALRCERALREEEREALMHVLPDARRARLARSREAAQEVLLAYGVLHARLCARYGWDVLPEIRCGKNGKPFFPDCPELFFNLSHTRAAVLVGLHDRPIGVDIEALRPVSGRLKKLFSQAETEREFWENWVKRESAVKRAGGSIMAKCESAAEERFFSFVPFAGYTACACTQDETSEIKLKCFTVK